MYYFRGGVHAVQFHNRSPYVIEDIEKLHARVSITPPVPVFQSNGVLSESYDNFMPVTYLRFQIRNLMSTCNNTLKKCKPPWLAEDENFIILNSNSYLEKL